MKRVLVTGGAGFIGSHLCEYLLDAGNSVICLDNFYCSNSNNMSRFLNVSEFEFIRQDVRNPFDINCDEIYHLACPASPVHYQRNPVQTIETAFIGTLNALKCARDNGAKLLITSTSEIYGDPLESPQAESYWGNVNPVGDRSCYDEGKRAGEALSYSWKHQFGTDVRIARLFNTYGPRMSFDDGRVIPNFLTQAIRGEDLIVYGDGSQTRSFCFVKDTINALYRYMLEPNIDISFRDRLPVLNIGNPDERTIFSVAELISKRYDVGIKFNRLPPDDPKKRKPDITSIQTLFSWSPETSFNAGLNSTISWFEGYRRTIRSRAK